MATVFLDDEQWAVIKPLLPTNQRGARRVDDRRVISGIVHVPRSDCRKQDTPLVYGSPTTIYNRSHRWSQRGIWQGMFAVLAEVMAGGIQAIDSTTAKARRAAASGEGGPKARPLGARTVGAGLKSMP